jgi:hypothetical protein
MGLSSDHAIEIHPHPRPPLEGEGTGFAVGPWSKSMSSVKYVWVLVFFWLAYATFVIRLIVKSAKYEKHQLVAQSMIALLIPFIGALLIHGMHRASNAPVEKVDRNFLRQDYPDGDDVIVRGNKD